MLKKQYLQSTLAFRKQIYELFLNYLNKIKLFEIIGVYPLFEIKL